MIKVLKFIVLGAVFCEIIAAEKIKLTLQQVLKSVITGKDSAEMVLIPAGEFLMGSPDGEGESDEHPQHKVYLDAFYMDKYEVTNEQFAKFLNKYGKDTDDSGNKMIYENDWGIIKVVAGFQPAVGYSKNPVVYVTWYGANQYAKYYNKRLPTEAEWEKAARSGSNTKYCFGNKESELGDYCWHVKNKPHPVGEKKPNKWGLYDMHGNVYEWCRDWYDGKYYEISPAKNPAGPDKGSTRVLRGGSWGYYANSCRSASRSGYSPLNADALGGFRCVADARTK